jgi:hypothetical protein
MAKLNQIIAIEKSIKAKSYSEISELHKAIQKPELFNGFSKNYQKKDEAGEDLPSESKRVQYTTDDVLRTLNRKTVELLNVTARKDYTNCSAKASVVVEGKTLITDAPVSYLLFLEKQLNDLHTFISCLPVLDPNEEWGKDANSGLFKSKEIVTHRTKKVVRPIVKYDATPEHPAQTDLITEDVIAGYWHQIKQSGAMGRPDKEKILARVEKLSYAIKQAREEANSCSEVPVENIGENILTYVLEG